MITKEEIKFWKYFKTWQLDDIDKAMNSKAYVGAAKLICCAIDALASFRFGATANQGSKFRFVSFIKEFMPEFKRRLKFIDNDRLIYKRSVLEMFYNNFRSGLIHEGLPGVGSELIISENKTLLFNNPNSDTLQINIIGLYEYLKVVFEKYEKRLYKEKEFSDNFRRRLSYITNPRLISKMK